MSQLTSFYAGHNHNPFTGVFNKIQSITSTIIPSSIVKLTGSSDDLDYPITNVYDSSMNYWRTLDDQTPNQWISIDFHKNVLKLEAIQFRTADIDLFPLYKIYGKRINQKEEFIQSFSLARRNH